MRKGIPLLNGDTIYECVLYVSDDDLWSIALSSPAMRKIALPLAVKRVSINLTSAAPLRSLQLCLTGPYANKTNVRDIRITARDVPLRDMAKVAILLEEVIGGMTNLCSLHIAPMETLLAANATLGPSIVKLKDIRDVGVDWAGPEACAVIRQLPKLRDVTFALSYTPHEITFDDPQNAWRSDVLRVLHVQDCDENAFEHCAFPLLERLIIGTDDPSAAGTTMDVQQWANACPRVQYLHIGESTYLSSVAGIATSFPDLKHLRISGTRLIELALTRHIDSVTMTCPRPMGEWRVARIFESLAALTPKSIALRGDMGSYHSFFRALRTVKTAMVCAIDVDAPMELNGGLDWIDDFYVSA